MSDGFAAESQHKWKDRRVLREEYQDSKEVSSSENESPCMETFTD